MTRLTPGVQELVYRAKEILGIDDDIPSILRRQASLVWVKALKPILIKAGLIEEVDDEDEPEWGEDLTFEEGRSFRMKRAKP